MLTFNHKAVWAMVVLQQVPGFVWPVESLEESIE